MVNELNIKQRYVVTGDVGPDAKKVKEAPQAFTKVRKKIRDRCDNCYIPDCWCLISSTDNGQIYVPPQFFEGLSKKGRAIQIKQLLFRWAYDRSPPVGQSIWNICKHKNCINPAHFITRTWKPTYEDVSRMVLRAWITWEQAEKWYGYEGTEEQE
jgi:hypothetical protein